MKSLSVNATALTCTVLDGACGLPQLPLTPCLENLPAGLWVRAASPAMGALVMLLITVLKAELQ